MSSNIFGGTLTPPAHNVDTLTPSNTIRCLTEAFGSLPITLSDVDLDTLNGMRIAGVQGMDCLMLAIGEHNYIKVWRE